MTTRSEMRYSPFPPVANRLFPGCTSIVVIGSPLLLHRSLNYKIDFK